MSAAVELIPGTSIPLCLCCEDEPAAFRDTALGPVCAECIPHLTHATAALARVGLLHPKTQLKRKAK